MTSEKYKAAVLHAKEHILAGDIFQIVLSQRFERRTFADPFEIYRALRIVNPSPYMAYLQVLFLVIRPICLKGLVNYNFLNIWLYDPYHQARGCILVASSPEILTRVKKVNHDKAIMSWTIVVVFFSFVCHLFLLLIDRIKL